MNLSQSADAQISTPLIDNFRADVLNGLKSSPKRLFSKYFYDKEGDQLFQQIMQMPEYYLTACELDVFRNRTGEIAEAVFYKDSAFDLIELGAGDGMKSVYLLQYLVERETDFTYIPVDISGNILSVLNEELQNKMPELKVVPLEGEYFSMLDKAAGLSVRRKVVFFLGGNIGNMEIGEANNFCREVRRRLNPGDLFVIGFDLMKNPHTVLNAYNDAAGITAAFNLNLLSRMNNELDADFNLDQFQHYQTYDPVSGACRSYLVSLTAQVVRIGDEEIAFGENELIDMEVSQKFSPGQIMEMAKSAGFQIRSQIADSKNWFVDSVWQV
ncbi:L-histidine N(alpha)-methyltransferase [Chryseobacterium sp.]|uniref:L-histidine N(alpha)-methyltransferase n=1 Tax=Chryseobacterium sp. TaxID=1871047 RepID=UPI0011CA2C2D|nr:L-histidine N(alpha)-methyltransferase [Chryseobacterium sp.]TXF79481.1 L-histidine N(alpha)-methyltransferase [Chryseobacterium sp.]